MAVPGFTDPPDTTPLAQVYAVIRQLSAAIGDASSAHGLYVMTANQPYTSGSQATAGGFALDVNGSSPDIGDYLSLNTDAGAGVWTATTPGIYYVAMVSKWASNASGHRYIYARQNNVEIDSISAAPGNGAIQTVRWVGEALHVQAGDDVRMRCMQNAGNLDLLGTGARNGTYVYFEYKGALT